MAYLRSYCEVELNTIKNNFTSLRKFLSDDVKMLAVIKADAYGHGANEVASILDDVSDYFAVATVEEGILLREAGFDKKILILGYSDKEEYERVFKYNLIPVVYRYLDAECINEMAKANGKVYTVHFAIDTGMGRIGFLCNKEGIEEANKALLLKNIFVEGIFSHFACADEIDKTMATLQAKRFKEFNDGLIKDIPVKHLANSAGIVDFDKYRFNMVRAGIVIYGYAPSMDVDISKTEIKPALSWYAHVTNIKNMKAGDTVSYGATKLTKDSVIATVSVGYADGYPRLLSNKGKVIINGKYANIIGRVCMDQMMVDITDIEGVSVADKVTLIGTCDGAKITADDIAELTGTISYEVLCDIGKRVPRVYI